MLDLGPRKRPARAIQSARLTADGPVRAISAIIGPPMKLNSRIEQWLHNHRHHLTAATAILLTLAACSVLTDRQVAKPLIGIASPLALLSFWVGWKSP